MAVCDICGKRIGFSDMCFSYNGVNLCKTCNDAKNEEAMRKKREEEHKIKLEHLRKQGAKGYYEYKVISLLDNAGLFKSNSGRIDVQAMSEILNNLGIEGWHLVTAYSNEAGKNALSGGAGGAIVGINSTVDENILIFERFVAI